MPNQIVNVPLSGRQAYLLYKLMDAVAAKPWLGDHIVLKSRHVGHSMRMHAKRARIMPDADSPMPAYMRERDACWIYSIIAGGDVKINTIDGRDLFDLYLVFYNAVRPT